MTLLPVLPRSYEAWKAWSGQGAADNRYGMIHMYDYALDKNVENDDAYESALNDFKDYVNQLKNLRQTAATLSKDCLATERSLPHLS